MVAKRAPSTSSRHGVAEQNMPSFVSWDCNANRAKVWDKAFVSYHPAAHQKHGLMSSPEVFRDTDQSFMQTSRQHLKKNALFY